MKNYPFKLLTKLLPLGFILFSVSFTMLYAQSAETSSSKTMTIYVHFHSYYGKSYQEIILSEPGQELKRIQIIEKSWGNRLKRNFKFNRDVIVKERDMKSKYNMLFVLEEIEQLKAKGWKIVASNHAVGIGMSEDAQRSVDLAYFLLER